MYIQIENARALVATLADPKLSRSKGRAASKAAKPLMPHAKHSAESALHHSFNQIADVLLNCTKVPLVTRADVLTISPDMVHDIVLTENGKHRAALLVRKETEIPHTIKNRVVLTDAGATFVDMSNPFKKSEGVWGPKQTRAKDKRRQYVIVGELSGGLLDGKPMEGTYYEVKSGVRYAYHHSLPSVLSDMSEACKVAFDCSLRARDIEAMQNDPRWAEVAWVSNVLYGATNENHTEDEATAAMEAARQVLEDRARKAISMQAPDALVWLRATVDGAMATTKEAKMECRDRAKVASDKASKRQEGISYFASATAEEISEASCVAAVRDGQNAVYMDELL